MKFQIPDIYPSNYMMTIDFYLWIAVVVIGLISVVLFFIKIHKTESDLQKPYLYGISFFLLLLSMQRVAYIISIKIAGADYNFWTNLGYICSLAGMTSFFFGIEKSAIKKTRYLLSVISFLGVIVGSLSLINILDRNISMKITYIISTLATIIIIFLFAWMISKSTGIIRRKSIITFVGVIVLFVGIMMDSELVYGGLWPTMPLVLPPILNSIGLLTITWTNL
ncbi:MAG: hypothetical protein ACTSWX_08565 [Promethearchaeota archaeon]